jgi:death-on-curing family protein
MEMAHAVLAEFFKDDPEPIPAWEEGDPNRLAECRASIEVQAFGILKYPDLPSAVAKLFYSTIKAHSFPNGNKRYALVLAIALLVKNGYMLTAARGVGADEAKRVASTDPHQPETAPDEVISGLAEFYANNMAPIAEALDQLGGGSDGEPVS